MMEHDHLEIDGTDPATGYRAGLTLQKRPRSETEIAVGSVFAEILGTSTLPRTVSLFDLGLDSLSVTLACARLEQATGVPIRFSQIFRAPTLAELAAWIDAARAKLDAEPSRLARAGARPAAELVAITPIQAETVRQNIVVKIAWAFDTGVDDTALEDAVNDIHLRHQPLQAKYFAGPDLGLAEVPADPGKVRFHRLELGDGTAATEEFWRILRPPLRLGEGEVWRCALARDGRTGRTLFGLVVDHTAFDGRSWDILTAELPVAYAARVAGQAPQWSGRTASLAEMAADFRAQLASADVDAQRQYWRDELHEVRACRLPGPRDGSASVIPANRGARFTPAGPASSREFTVPHWQLRRWDDHDQANGMTTSVGSAAAYTMAIIRAGGSRDFAMLVPVANRAGDVIDRTITNRVGSIFLRPNSPWRSGHVIARMRDAYHQAMASRDVLMDPKEQAAVLTDSGPDGLVHLERMACLSYNSVPDLTLGGISGTMTFEYGDERRIPFPVRLQVVPVPDGLRMELSVRTDLHEAGVADRIFQQFLAILNDGPEPLERETAH